MELSRPPHLNFASPEQSNLCNLISSSLINAQGTIYQESKGAWIEMTKQILLNPKYLFISFVRICEASMETRIIKLSMSLIDMLGRVDNA